MAISTSPSSGEAVTERRRPRPDALLPGTMLVLATVGVLMVFSASQPLLELRGQDAALLMQRQLLFAAVGLAAFLLFSFVDYREFRHFAPYIYGATLLLLLVVLTRDPVQGAQRWIPIGPFQLQPSEFAKLGVILVLAAVLAPARQEGMRWRRIWQGLLVVALPALLIFIQPDLGTMLVFGFVAVVMLFAAGTTVRQLIALLVGGTAGVLSVLKLQLLADYQVARLQSFLNPLADARGAGYNQLQSELAIGSGQLVGKGWLNGSLTNLDYVPAQSTDFIFTAVGEQFGFLGATVVLVVFGVIVWRLVVIAAASRDRYGALVAVGIAAMFVFHIFVNVGMTVGIMPVTGLPLPFVSAGGSSFLTMAAALGIAHSIWRRRSPVPGETYIV